MKARCQQILIYERKRIGIDIDSRTNITITNRACCEILGKLHVYGYKFTPISRKIFATFSLRRVIAINKSSHCSDSMLI